MYNAKLSEQRVWEPKEMFLLIINDLFLWLKSKFCEVTLPHISARAKNV